MQVAGRAKAAPAGMAGADWDRFAIVACALVGLIVGLAQAMRLIHEPFDAGFYWRATLPNPYAEGAGAYVYPPVLAQLLEPVRAIGWGPFIVAWTTLLFASLGYLAGRWSVVVLGIGALALAVPWVPSWLFSPTEAALIGNVTLPMTAAIVLGMRYPAMWAVPLLTKMTPGIGVLWFAFRREWRSLGIALGVTAGIALASFVISPDAWRGFVSLATANLGTNANGMMIVGPPLPVRLLVAAGLLWWGARTDRAWVVPIACGLSVIGLYGLGTITAIAFGAIRLRADDRREDAVLRLGGGDRLRESGRGDAVVGPQERGVGLD